VSEEPKVRIRVGAVIVRRGNEILLVRHEKAGRVYWLLPGGGLEFGETLAQALERELMEECGLTVQCGQLLFMAESLPPDKHRQVLNLTFKAELISGEAHLAEKDSERLKGVAWVKKADLTGLTFFPDFKDSLLAQWDCDFQLQAENLGNLWKD
jgi:8-oxo-dGTP diphosphatase